MYDYHHQPTRARGVSPAVVRRWVALGCLLAAGISHWLIAPSLVRLPDRLSSLTTLSGELKLLDGLNLGTAELPVSLTVDVQGRRTNDNKFFVTQEAKFNSILSAEPILLRQVLDGVLERLSLRADYLSVLRLALGTETKRDEFWINPGDATYIAPTEAAGKHWIIPPGRARDRDYDLYDMTTDQGLRFKPAGEADVEGFSTKVYEAALGYYDIGTGTIDLFSDRVRLDAVGNIRLYLAPRTGVLVKQDVDVALQAQVGGRTFRLIETGLQTESDSLRSALKRAKAAGLGWALARTWFPLLLIVVALGLLRMSRARAVSGRASRGSTSGHRPRY